MGDFVDVLPWVSLCAFAMLRLMVMTGRADPSTPNAAKIQEKFSSLKQENLGPYELPGNQLTRDSYENLVLPWNCSPPVGAFPESGFTRLEWDRNGKLSGPEHFFLGDQILTIETMEKRLGTASMVTRWREAHPGLAGTEEDVLAKMAREMRELLGGKEELVIGQSCVLLLFKKGSGE